MPSPLVIYHRNCSDGMGAAYAAWKALPSDTEYMAMHYGDALDVGITAHRDVYLVDFSFPPDVMRDIKAVASSLFLLDHHDSALRACKGTEFEASIDMTRSGAGMTWDHFGARCPRPRLIDYIEDHDLWNHALPDWEELRCEIEQLPLEATPDNFRKWDDLAQRLESPDSRNEIIQKHKPVVEFRRNIINTAVSKAYDVHFAGYIVPAVNSTVFQSEIGNALCRGKPFAVIYTANKNGFSYSLRSDREDPNAVEVQLVAEMFGGGGHKNAAGLMSSVAPMPYLPKKV